MLTAGTRTYLAAEAKPGELGAVELTRRELARQAEVVSADVRRGMSLLASVGSVSPFVGLLGTVVGIISAFQGIAAEGSGGLAAVSAGIAEALIVTAIGLLVAIPSVLAFNFLSARADQLLLALDQSRGEFIDYLENQGGGGGEHGSGTRRGDGTSEVLRPVTVEARARA
jgi:biopolymer transport protein ExbB